MKKQDIRILLVDDEPDILEILKYNLTSEGYQVSTAKNGIEGVEKAKKKKATPNHSGCDEAGDGWDRGL